MARTPARPAARAKVGMISLGCPKNLIDTEVLLGKVAEEHTICGDPEDADVVIVNTCGFIDQAREESLATIREVAGWKAEGKIRGLVVAGCMAQRYGDEIRKAVPSIDSILAMAEYGRIDQVLSGILDAKGAAKAAQAPWRTLVAPDGRVPVVREETGRLRVTPRHYAYLRVSEGCSNACTFCSIPTFRGLFKSKPRDMILAEARELASSGARELCLISQDTTDWGADLSGRDKKGGLASLLDDLASIDGLRWLRILYAYPGHVSDDLVATMARLQEAAAGRAARVVPYLDMPIQHIDSRMLKRMGRRHTREETRALLTKLRADVPGIVLRTTFIAGFPGETLAEHEAVVDFIREFAFERLGAFPYSHEKSTPAGEKFEDDIPADEKKRRADALMAAQQPIAFARNERLVGQEIEVVVESRLEEESTPEREVFVGRSTADAPEIDPVVYIEVARKGRGKLDAVVEPGTFLSARVLKGLGYDLIAQALGTLEDPVARPASRARAPRKKLPLVRGS